MVRVEITKEEQAFLPFVILNQFTNCEDSRLLDWVRLVIESILIIPEAILPKMPSIDSIGVYDRDYFEHE